jgi:hypothetical protein
MTLEQAIAGSNCGSAYRIIDDCTCRIYDTRLPAGKEGGEYQFMRCSCGCGETHQQFVYADLTDADRAATDWEPDLESVPESK